MYKAENTCMIIWHQASNMYVVKHRQHAQYKTIDSECDVELLFE